LSFGAAEASFFADVNADNLIVSINHAKKAQRRRIQHERDIEMTVVKAAAVQISPVLYSREGTVEKVVEKIIALGHQGVQFATFPEAIVPYYPYFSFVQRPFEMRSEHLKLMDQAVTIPSPTVDAIGAARQPVIVSGSGVLWSHAWDEMKAFVEKAGIPFYTTPQGRGVIPDDHPFSYLTMRNDAFRQADLIIILGTRTNYVIGHAAPPRFSAEAKIARIEIDPEELGTSARNIDIPIVGDCKSVLQQLCEAVDARTAERFQGWRQKLADGEAAKRTRAGGNYPTDGDIHPLRLCEEIKNFQKRDTILCVDGQEILNFGRQSIPTFTPGHRLNSGPFGTMGVGLPFAVGAKAAKPNNQVICLHGDGSFGQNAMELDTAVRHKLPLLCVISLNGGWTADPQRNKPGRDLGYTRYDIVAQGLGAHGEYVEKPEDIRPALERAQKKVDEGMVALVNVKTDYRARATTVRFSNYET